MNKTPGRCGNLPVDWTEKKVFWLGSQPDGSCVVLVASPRLEFGAAMMQCGRIGSVLLEMDDGEGVGEGLDGRRGVLRRQLVNWWYQSFIEEGRSYWIALSRWSWVWSGGWLYLLTQIFIKNMMHIF